jgi:hypothetical protein
MSAGFAILCVLTTAIPLGILFVLYGPTRGKPVVAVPRASMQAIPQVRSVQSVYRPEAVFAVEQAGLIQNASAIARVPMRHPSGPPPLPPRRMARGSEAPPHRETTVPEGNPFVDEAATYIG